MNTFLLVASVCLSIAHAGLFPNRARPQATVTETITIRDFSTTVTLVPPIVTLTSVETSTLVMTTTSTVTVTVTPLVPLQALSFSEFTRAVSFYNVTSAGGIPPPPSKAVYQGYLDHIAGEMCLVEQAMLLANLIWESSGFQFIEEIACRGVGVVTPRCPYGLYHGRGYIQLSWDYNYRSASLAIFGDDRLLMVPDLAAKPDVAWQTALWYWRTHVRPRLIEQDAIRKRSFGVAVRAINGAQECSIPKRMLKNMRRHPKHNYQAALNRLAIFNALLKDWRLVWEQDELGTLDGCLILDKQVQFEAKLDYIDDLEKIMTLKRQ